MEIQEKILAHTRILVVEDEPACLDVLRLFLETSGADVTACSSAEEAVDLLATEEIDAVLSDIRLDGMDGIALLQHIRNKGIEIPVIMITAHASLQSAISALKLGADDYLLKPIIRADVLVRAVHGAIRNHFLRCQNAILKNQLEESELSFKTVFNNISDMAFAFTLQEGGAPNVFEQTNNASAEILGYTPAALHRMSIREITAKTHRKELLSCIASCLPPDQKLMEAVFIRADGTPLPVEISCHAVNSATRATIILIARDATMRIQAEAKTALMIEQERQRTGRELHDTICQDLACINMLSKTLLKNTQDPDIAAIESSSKSALAAARKLAMGMLPVFEDSKDLETAVAQMAGNLQNQYGVAFSINIEHPIVMNTEEGLLHLFRIIQEASVNAIKHGQTKKIAISLINGEGMHILRVANNGSGITDETHKPGSMGLLVMQQRSRIIGGSLSINSKDNGTVVELRWQETDNA